MRKDSLNEAIDTVRGSRSFILSWASIQLYSIGCAVDSDFRLRFRSNLLNLAAALLVSGLETGVDEEDDEWKDW